MRTIVSVLSLALLAGCAPKEEAPPAEAPPAAPAVSIADFAGTWNTVTTLPGSDPVQSQLIANADGTGSLILTGRDPIPTTLSIMGDSLISVSAEYESVLRAGVRVMTRSAMVRSGETLTGVLTATYKTATGDEVVTGTLQSTRAPQ